MTLVKTFSSILTDPYLVSSERRTTGIFYLVSLLILFRLCGVVFIRSVGGIWRTKGFVFVESFVRKIRLVNHCAIVYFNERLSRIVSAAQS